MPLPVSPSVQAGIIWNSSYMYIEKHTYYRNLQEEMAWKAKQSKMDANMFVPTYWAGPERIGYFNTVIRPQSAARICFQRLLHAMW